MKWRKAEQSSNPEQSEDAGSDAFPAFAPVRSDVFENLSGLPDPIPVPAGETLIEQDSICDLVWLLRGGLVRLSYATKGGRETTLGMRTAGWFAGAVNVVTAVPSVYAVRTVTPCVVSRIPAEEFSNMLARSARLSRHMLSSLCRDLLSQTTAQACLMTESAEERLATFMRERSHRFPHLATVDTLPVLKQRELAQMLSVTPEHLSRLLHKDDDDPDPGHERANHWLV